ncbi:MAG: CIA30 family protein [Elusimicrobia bacterium]|nr:CIA30 family protein [Elusimicrobiota bacterium]
MKKITNISLFIIILAVSFSEADIVDKMNDISGWSSVADSGASVTSISSANGETGKAVKIECDLISGDWVQIQKTYSYSDLSTGDSIRYWCRGAGSKNDVEMKMFDADGDIFVSRANGITNKSDWSSTTLSQSSFSLWKDEDGNPFGDGTMTWNDITKISIVLLRGNGGSGYFDIDRLAVYQQNAPGVKTIDECENQINSFGNSVSTLTEAGKTGWVELSVETSDPSPKGGKYYKMKYAQGDATWMIGAGESMESGGSTYDASDYSYFNFYMKVATGEEEPLIEAYDSADGDAKLVSEYGGLKTEWTFYSIPLADFPKVDTSDFKEIKIVFKGGSGTVYMDNLWLSESSSKVTNTGEVSSILDFEGPFNSQTNPSYADQNGEITLTSVKGYSDKAMRITYDFKAGGWLAIDNGTGYSMQGSKGLKIRCKGSGTNFNLQFKIKDVDSVQYFKNFASFTDTDGEWKTATVLNEELKFFSAGNDDDETLDLKNIKEIGFAITKAAENGTGTVLIDTIETISGEDFSKEREGSLISEIKIDNNPFSPNGDGVKDSAIFTYALSDYADVELEIYDLSGELQRRIKATGRIAGEHADMEWDGKDDSDETVKNGLYIYKLKAEDLNNKTDSITHVIAVIK